MTPQEEITDAFQTVGIMIRAKMDELCNTNKYLSAKELQNAYDVLNKYFDNQLMNPIERQEHEEGKIQYGAYPVYFIGSRQLVMRTVYTENNKYYVRWFGNFIEVERNPRDGNFKTIGTY